MSVNNNSANESKKFGFFSMLTMIVGGVIGTGIFFVNDALYEQTKSVGLSMIS